MISRVFRWAGIIIMVFAVLAEVQLLAGLGFAYFLRFRSTPSGLDAPLHHWHLTDTLGVVGTVIVPSLLFAIGFYLRRAGTYSPRDSTL